MIELRAPAKLTLSVRITGIRDDGYHLVDAEMVSLDLADRLLVTNGDGLEIPGHDVEPGGDNLVNRALALVGRRAHITIIKAIPPGAGLGGGSSDAAAVLAWAGYDDLMGAAGLGADVAFCLAGGRARVTGGGEVLSPLPFQDQAFTLLTPPFGCSTPVVYRRWDEMGGPRGDNGNDLEPAALDLVPDLARFRDELGDASGLTPRLAGSGSTWFVEGEFAGTGRVVAHTVPARSQGLRAEP